MTGPSNDNSSFSNDQIQVYSNKQCCSYFISSNNSSQELNEVIQQRGVSPTPFTYAMYTSNPNIRPATDGVKGVNQGR